MAFGPTTTPGSSIILVIKYIASGAEGIDFMLPIGMALVDDQYGVFWSPCGVVLNVPVVDLPDVLFTDRTSSAFRVLLTAPLTAGDQLAFLVVHA